MKLFLILFDGLGPLWIFSIFLVLLSCADLELENPDSVVAAWSGGVGGSSSLVFLSSNSINLSSSSAAMNPSSGVTSSLGEFSDCELRTVEETLLLQGDREDFYTCVRIEGDLVFKKVTPCWEGAFYIRDETGDLYLRGDLDTKRYAQDTSIVVEKVVVGGDFYPNKDLCTQLFCECQVGLEFGTIADQ